MAAGNLVLPFNGMVKIAFSTVCNVNTVGLYYRAQKFNAFTVMLQVYFIWMER